MSTNKDIYFASDESSQLVKYLIQRSDSWFQALQDNQMIDKIKRSWFAYHGFYYENSHAISWGGENGELVNIPVNHYSNISQNILNMVTSSRPAFQARAINTDLKSQIQTNLANGLLEFYMRDKRLERDLKTAVEYAINLSSGYIKMEWNATAGRIVDGTEDTFETSINPETGAEEHVLDEEGNKILKEKGMPIYEGDVEFSTLSPLDVVFDTTKETTKADWQLCRTFKNKFDLAAKYPEFEEQIKALKTKSEMISNRINLTPFDETVDVPVYEFYHRSTESVPGGRYCLYLSKDIVLVDQALPYQKLPIFRISPRDILGTPFGYTNMFDLLPLQDQLNALYSTVCTNNHAFGVQSIYASRDSALSVSQLSEGLNLIEGNGNDAPQPIQLTASSPETYQLIDRLIRDMETISGVNAVARGNPDPKQNLRSGNALALVQSQALQFVSGLQQQYIQLIEDVGTNLIVMLQTFATSPRIAEIAGVSGETQIEEFTKEDLQSVNRVVVEAGNALSQTTAGRVEMATTLMQMGQINAKQYITVMNTGKLETATESQNKQSQLIRAENERLLKGKPVRALLTDDHAFHLQEHQVVLADPTLRFDDELVNRTLAHIQEHINILSNPEVANLLMSMGQKPIQPPMPPAPPQGGQGGEMAPPPQEMGPGPGSEAQGPAPLLSNPKSQDVSVLADSGALPNPALPPESNLAQTGAELYNQNIRGGV